MRRAASGVLDRGIALYNRGRHRAALAAFQAALRAGERPEEARFFIAHCRSSLERAGAAGAAERRERFRRLAKADRYAEAIAEGERILDAGPAKADLAVFWDPWERPRGEPARKTAERRRRLEASVKGAARSSPWYLYFRGSLTEGFADLADFRALARAPRARYGWMLRKAGWAHSMTGRFEEAARLFRAALAAEPAEWSSRGYLAEALLCLGNEAGARRQLALALARAPKGERGSVLAWMGELELWQGRYRAALKLLERACALKAQHALCWRAAALLKLGRVREALRRLDETIRLVPNDLEAFVWRGEAKRLLGRPREALKDLGREPLWLWAGVNRALAYHALGDTRRFKKEFAALPDFFITHLRRRAGSVGDRELLEKGLALARGFRREDYFQASWMGADARAFIRRRVEMEHGADS